MAAGVIGVITLNVIEAQAANGVYDTDGDKLIEIDNLEQLDAVRYDANGDGRADKESDNASYAAAFLVSGSDKVCNAGCTGYELKRSLDFDSADSYAGSINSAWTTGEGWAPIGGFKATFDGNGNTITGLYINRPNVSYIGLFSYTGGSAVIQRIGLLEADVTGNGDVGALVGAKGGMVNASYATGTVTGNGNYIGGLVGLNRSGTISGSYSAVFVTGLSLFTGGLAGVNYGTIQGSYATGDVTGVNHVGGLLGHSAVSRVSRIINSYATGYVIGAENVGGLVGTLHKRDTILNSYAIGTVIGNKNVGGLIGLGYSSASINFSYWNSEVNETGIGGGSFSGTALGKTTMELKAPTGRTGIYAAWDQRVWDFGTSSQYPALKADMDGDGKATALEFGTQGRTPPLGVSVSRAGTDQAPPVRIGTAIPVAATFTKAVTGFTVGDVTVANGTAGNFSGSGASYTFDVTPSAIGRVAVDIAAGVAMDADGNGNTAAVRLVLGIPYDDNHNGVIELSELFTAIDDYFEGDLVISHLFALIDLYFGQSGS